MNILVSWLRELVDLPDVPTTIADRLAASGFEVASIEPAPDGALSPDGRPFDGDAVIDLEITANRPDCLSVVGIAREMATAYRLPLRGVPAGLDGPHAEATGGVARAEADGLRVVLEDAERCPRYAAAVADVKIAPSPAWLANRLTAAGVRPINNVVDVTNYVLIELGHPLHAFDLSRLTEATLRIRTARAGEKLTTLDGEQRALDPEMLVIADAERPQAVAGVMGGAQSEVWAGTRVIALESAYFKPASVRRTSKRLGLKTEASSRFERGANINAPVVALERACELLEQIGAGKCRGGLIDCYPSPRPPGFVTLRRSRLAHLLGRPVSDDTVTAILEGLGFRPEATADGWRTTVPSWRVDVAREADLIEEVARHDGYDRIPTTFPALTAMPGPSAAAIDRDRLVRQVLTAAGFSEAVTFVFIEAAAAAPFAEGREVVPLAYPLSELFAVLRPSLLPGLIGAVAYNRRRERRDIRLFEVGSQFSIERGEQRGIGLAWAGAASPEHWSGEPRQVDFFDAKGVVERVLSALDAEGRWVAGQVPYLVPGRTAVVMGGDRRLGVVGQLLPEVAEARDLPAGQDVYVAELDLDAIADRAPAQVQVTALPRYPSVVRDLSILVDRALPAEAVRGTIVAAAPPTLVAVREFDRYQGKGIPDSQVSLSLHLVFRHPDRTLTDAEVQEAMDAIVGALASRHGAVRR